MNARAALDRAYDAWARSQPQYAIDLWGDSPDSIEGHSRTTGGLASRAGNGNHLSAALDLSLPDVLNARPGPETARGPHAPISPPGSSVEGAGGVRVRAVGNGGNPASSLDNQARGSVRSTDAPEARSREEAMNEPTKVGVEVETPQPKAPPETQTTEVEVETPEGQPNVEVDVETPKQVEA